MHRLEDLNLRNARALVRVDFNVPLGSDGSVADDARIRAALPTLQHLLDQQAACVVMTHLGRPCGEPDPNLSLKPVVERLSQLLAEHAVRRCDEVVGPRAKEMAEALKGGEVLVLENLRFHPGEKKDAGEFASNLAGLGRVYNNDAFAACHRAHASVHAVVKKFAPDEWAIGRLVERELEALGTIVDSPEHPFIAVFGGAKAEDKLEAVRTLVDRVDRILIGGAMAYTFLRALGRNVGASKVEEDRLSAAREIFDRAGDKLVLPNDHVVTRGEGAGDLRTAGTIDGSFRGLAPRPLRTTALKSAEQRRSSGMAPWTRSKTTDSSAGTRRVAEAPANSGATTIVGGGETGEVVRRLGVQDHLPHVSTDGGAFLDYIAHGTLPTLDVLRSD